jgi:hypothetical protein
VQRFSQNAPSGSADRCRRLGILSIIGYCTFQICFLTDCRFPNTLLVSHRIVGFSSHCSFPSSDAAQLHNERTDSACLRFRIDRQLSIQTLTVR